MDFNFNLVTLLTEIITWGVIAFFAYRIHKKQMEKLKIWKIIVIIIVGLFSFSINLNMFDATLRLALLPLGVWLLYFIFKRKGKRWTMYRPYAWLGFGANFLFLASTLLAIPVHHIVFPKEDPATYISTIQDGSIINIHPSADERSLNKESLLNQLDMLRQEKFFSQEWYEDTYMNAEPDKRNERFPYQLIGTSSKWGSGLHTIIFIEDDGKGILITTSKKQLYFRSDESLFEEVEVK